MQYVHTCNMLGTLVFLLSCSTILSHVVVVVFFRPKTYASNFVFH